MERTRLMAERRGLGEKRNKSFTNQVELSGAAEKVLGSGSLFKGCIWRLGQAEYFFNF